MYEAFRSYLVIDLFILGALHTKNSFTKTNKQQKFMFNSVTRLGAFPPRGRNSVFAGRPKFFDLFSKGRNLGEARYLINRVGRPIWAEFGPRRADSPKNVWSH